MTKKTRSYLLPAISPSLDDFKRHVPSNKGEIYTDHSLRIL